MAVMVKKLRPFNDVEELKAFYESHFGSCETIWLRSINLGICYLVSAYNDTQVYLSGTDKWYTMENLMYDFKFYDKDKVIDCGMYEFIKE